MTDYSELLDRAAYIQTGPGVFVSKAEWQSAMWDAFPALACALEAVMAENVSVLQREAATTARYDAKLDAAEASLVELMAEADARDDQIKDMIKASGQECACGYDRPGDVCFGHYPMFKKVKDENAALRAKVAELEGALGWVPMAMDAVRGYERDYGESLSDLHLIGRIEESRDTPSFRVHVGHLRMVEAALRAKKEAGE